MSVVHVKSNTIADMTGTITVFNSAGSTTTAAATNLMRAADWNSVHNQLYTLGGNTANASTASGTNVVWQGAGNITLAGSTGTIVISGQGEVTVSKHLNYTHGGSTTSINISTPAGGMSYVNEFFVPQPLYFSKLQMPLGILGGTSTTIGTQAGTRTFSAAVYSTHNAVLYSRGTGANSTRLESVVSGQELFTGMVSISQASQDYSFLLYFSNQQTMWSYSYTALSVPMNLSFGQTGASGGILWQSLFSAGSMFLDIPIATTLTPGYYWLAYGMSSSTAGTYTLLSSGTTIFPRTSRLNFQYQPFTAAREFGSPTPLPEVWGGASFTTAGGGTLSAVPMSALTLAPAIMYWQLRG